MEVLEENTLGSEKGLTGHLRRYAVVYAFSQGYRFGSGATYDIDQLAEQAAKEILAPPPQYRKAHLAQLTRIAEKQIGIFVDHMIVAREVVYTGGEKEDVIGELTLAWAKDSLCPMWPLC